MCCCCCCSCHRKIIDIWSLALPSSRIVPCGTYMQTFINSVAAFHTKYFVYLALRRRISLTSAQAVSSQSSAVSKEPNIRREVRWVCWVSCTLTECIYLLFGLPRTARPQLSGSRCTTMFGWTLFVVVRKGYIRSLQDGNCFVCDSSNGIEIVFQKIILINWTHMMDLSFTLMIGFNVFTRERRLIGDCLHEEMFRLNTKSTRGKLLDKRAVKRA